MKKRILLVVLLLILLSVVSVVLKEPRTDRVWAPELEKTASAYIQEDGTVHIQNVRDWTYGVGAIKTQTWLDEVRLNPKNIVRTWFVLEPFAAWEAIGHTYLTFEFSDGSAYSFSVEARKEADETYSALKGLFNEYELAYTWGTERDFLTRRLLYLEHPVRMYPLAIDAEASEKLFLELVEQTNSVADNARFYNTLTASCTNVLAEFANKTAPGSVPYDISWNLPGLSDNFLMRIGLIPSAGTAEETRTAFDLTPYINEIEELAAKEGREFGQALRTLQPLKNVTANGITPQ